MGHDDRGPFGDPGQIARDLIRRADEGKARRRDMRISDLTGLLGSLLMRPEPGVASWVQARDRAARELRDLLDEAIGDQPIRIKAGESLLIVSPQWKWTMGRYRTARPVPAEELPENPAPWEKTRVVRDCHVTEGTGTIEGVGEITFRVELENGRG